MYKIGRATICRACGVNGLQPILKLDEMPPGDKYAATKDDIPTSLIPSDIEICPKCSHI